MLARSFPRISCFSSLTSSTTHPAFSSGSEKTEPRRDELLNVMSWISPSSHDSSKQATFSLAYKTSSRSLQVTYDETLNTNLMHLVGLKAETTYDRQFVSPEILKMLCRSLTTDFKRLCQCDADWTSYPQVAGMRILLRR